MAGSEPRLLTSDDARAAFLARATFRMPGEQEVFMVTKDRAELVFTRWQGRVRARSGWHTPLALVIALGIAVSTATFNDAFGLKGTDIKGAFVTLLLGSAFWFLWEVVRAFRTPDPSPDRFIEELAAGTERTDYVIPPQTTSNSR